MLERDEPRATVLVVEPDTAQRRSLARTLLSGGFEVLTAPDLDHAGSLLRSGRVEASLCSFATLHQGRGGAALSAIDPLHQVVIAAPLGQAGPASALAVEQDGEVVLLPAAPPELVCQAVGRAVRHRRAVEKLRRGDDSGARAGDHELVGQSDAMARLRRLALAVADLDVPLLLSGEPGTGKKLLGRWIHAHGRRRDSPLGWFDCELVAPERQERELRGDPETDEGPATPGLLRRLAGGTLVLGQIGSANAAVQRRLLGLLEPGPSVPPAAHLPPPRLVALAREPGPELVARGKLLPELWLHLAGGHVRLPPLRQRRDDIPLLAGHFVRRHAERLGRPSVRLSMHALRVLRARDWPGNVRELEQVVAAAVVVSGGTVIYPRDLAGVAGLDEPGVLGDAAPGGARLAELPYRRARAELIADFEAGYVRALLDACGGNRSEAARRAGLDRSNFRRLCRKVAAGSGTY
ncbi:MAG: sigma-54-dependent Fis family transcriptional regulator [Deltaproteobacteria bacterium]|nr:sigma-54-dependent Fis family transcriptional regulator [Deltaproteobacteria bacterium]